MKSIWQKVGHEQHFKKKISKSFKKNTFSLSPVFFFSLHQTTKKFLAFIKAAIHAFVISITGAFSVD